MISALAFALGVVSCGGPAGSRAGSDFISSHHDNITEKTMRLESEADMVASYHTDRRFDIGIGKFDRKGGARDSILFTFDELEGFFDRQNNKSLVVVIIEKNLWSDERMKEEVGRLRSYFVARGYKRISVQQGLGGGRGEYLDYVSPNNLRLPRGHNLFSFFVKSGGSFSGKT
jgi:hypothetical protein